MFDLSPIFIICLVVLFFCVAVVVLFFHFKRISEVRSDVLRRFNGREEFTPAQFFKMYNALKASKIKINSMDRPGCYVFKNMTKNIHYVGQSKNVLRRVNQHLNGKGNGDIYADYKYGSEFIIFIVKCHEDELNIVEKNLIREFDAYKNGYNKNSGIGRGY